MQAGFNGDQAAQNILGVAQFKAKPARRKQHVGKKEVPRPILKGVREKIPCSQM